MPESVTYYYRNGKDYAVFVYELDELQALDFYNPNVRPNA